MNLDDKLLCGVVGTAISATGAGLSITEIQAIVSIVITVLGFIISVFIPLIVKLVKKIKNAKEDGKITKEELEDIASTVKEIGEETESFIKEVSDKEKSEGGK